MDSYHYTLIRRALDILDQSPKSLNLAELAARMDMSPSHFQRLFTAWVGVSPLRYQQYLSLGLAKELLRRQATLLDTALNAGLSGTGRLHDLFVTWEAMTPGRYAALGRGLRIGWAKTQTPYGPAIGLASARGLCALGFAAEIGEEACLQDLCDRWPEADIHPDPSVAAQITAAIEGGGRLHVMGSALQIKVWEALLALPEGAVTSYGALAQQVGQPRAARAVGTAVGRNPLSCVIPCHRALRQSGALGGYHWGLPIKRAMLGRETARFDAG